MKVTELTIGSLVKTNKGKVIKVESISTKRQHRKLGYHEDNDPYHIKYVRITQVSPIPLTEDILKANGFERDEKKDTYWYCFYCFPNNDSLRNEEFGVECRKDCYTITDHWLMTIRYVHELQHALHLCRLNELADNFVIEKGGNK